MITVRRAVAADAQTIGAVFGAAVTDGWKYLDELDPRAVLRYRA
jgi:hypothetical protein